jgi:hypothetical protein
MAKNTSGCRIELCRADVRVFGDQWGPVDVRNEWLFLLFPLSLLSIPLLLLLLVLWDKSCPLPWSDIIVIILLPLIAVLTERPSVLSSSA